MAESSVVTVLFTDLVESLGMKSRLGDAASDELRRRHFGALEQTAARHRGNRVKTLGDGVMMVFGSPSDALGCAVEMQRENARLSRESGESLGLRVGVHLGETTHEDDDYFGTAVDVASRVCAAAQGDQILASDVVRMLVSARGSFSFSPVGPLDVKGLTEPLVVWELDWRSGAAVLPLPGPLERGWWGSYVGRADERTSLSRALEDARAGDRRVVLLAGEPGIGKTRLAAEAARSAHSRGMTVLYGRCDEGLSAPYQPFVEALSDLCAGEVSSIVDAALAQAPDVVRLVPELGPESPTAGAYDDSDQLRVFRAVDSFLKQLSASAPLVVVLDDLHWADRSTLMLLRYIARSRSGSAMCVIGTYRETDLDRLHPLADVLADLRRERLVERVLLRGLPTDDLARLVADRAGHEAPPEFVEAVYTETQGNPFFAEEVLRHLVDSGVLYRDDGRWVSDVPVEELGIPEGVREVVGRRLARLSDAANRALQLAAVVGAEFDAPTLQHAGGFGSDELLDALDEALAAGLIAEVQLRPGRYVFSHAIVRQTLYGELGSSRRVQMHWRVGEALEAAGASSGELARHFAEGVLAGDAAKAVDACIAAGDRAYELAANHDALRHYELAVATVDQIAVPDPDRRFRSLLGVLACARDLYDVDRMRDATEQILALSRTHGRGDWLAELALQRLQGQAPGLVDPELDVLVSEALEAIGPEPTRERCQLLIEHAFAERTSGRATDVSALLDEASRIAEMFDDRLVDAAMAFGEAAMSDDDPDAEQTLARWEAWSEALRAAGQVRRADLARMGPSVMRLVLGDRAGIDEYLTEMAKATEDGAWVWPGPRAIMSATLALAEGDPQEAKARAAELKPYRQMLGLALAQDFLVLSARLQQGTVDRSVSALEAFVDVAAPAVSYSWKCILGCVYVAVGRTGDARDVLTEVGRHGFAALPRGMARQCALAYGAELCAWLSARDQAAALLGHIEPYGGQIILTWRGLVLTGAADRCIAQLLATVGRLDEAEARYRAAIELEERNRFGGCASWTRYWYARLLAERGHAGDDVRARAMLDEVVAFTRPQGMHYLHGLADGLSAMA